MTSDTSAKRFSVGLTGGIGSGKSTVADLFAQCGASVIDTDQIAHKLTETGGAAIPAILAHFGNAYIGVDGAMDRAKMRERVFSDPEEKKHLEAILHPLIRVETERAAAQASGTYLLFVVPLLVESGTWRQRISRLLVVDCPEPLQVARVMKRNGLSQSQVLAIMAAQVPRDTRVAAADDVIMNDGDSAALVPQVERLHALYVELSRGETTKALQHL